MMSCTYSVIIIIIATMETTKTMVTIRIARLLYVGVARMLDYMRAAVMFRDHSMNS